MGCGQSNLFSASHRNEDDTTVSNLNQPIELQQVPPVGRATNPVLARDTNPSPDKPSTGGDREIQPTLAPTEGTTPREATNSTYPLRTEAEQGWPTSERDKYRSASLAYRELLVAIQPLIQPVAISPSVEPSGETASNKSDETSIAQEGHVTVFRADNEPIPGPAEDDEDLLRLREKCPQFRILIIGKANAGKTTILQRMCNTTENPIIRNQYRHVIDPSTIQPTDARGIHDINNELTFTSNPAFVFHDSPGFEAGSTKELEDVREFIAQKATTNQLKDQLHAIWYCLPTDSARPLSDAEMSFFEQGTGRTPVIAIFTKYDGMVLSAYNKLRYEGGLDRKEAKEQAPKHADELFRDSEYYLKRVQSSGYPPARYLRIQEMQKLENDCAELSKQTLEALDSRKLQLLFASVQQNNIQLSTDLALQL